MTAIALAPRPAQPGAGQSMARWAVRALLLFLFVLLDVLYARLNGAGHDWAPLWAAGRVAMTHPAAVYDFHLVTALQQPLVGDIGTHPFIYPPTALLLAVPGALMPFWLSFPLFAGAALFLLTRASRPWSADPVLLVACPPVFAAAFSGQFSLLILALILFALASLRERPALAGVALGVAAALKPQLLVLAPFALVAGRHWRVIFHAVVAGSALCVLATLVFGADIWLRWLDAMPRFHALIVGSAPLLRNSLSPAAAAIGRGINPAWVMLGALLITVPAVVVQFRRSNDLALQLVALLGGALLLSPYAMNYELAGLAPVLLSPRLRGPAALIVPLLWAVSMFLSLSVAGLILAYSLLAFAPAQRALRALLDQLRVKRGVDVSPRQDDHHIVLGSDLASQDCR